MRKFLLFIMALFSTASFALDYGAETSLTHLQSCFGKKDLTCVTSGNCNACTWCEMLDKMPANKCQKDAAMPALEGLLGVQEGHCSLFCGAKKRIGKPVFQNAKQGDTAVIINSTSKSGLANITADNGAQSFQTYLTQAGEIKVGSSVTVAESAISGPINSATGCVRGTANKWIKECFKGWINCDSNIKKSERCSICKDIKSCGADTEELMSAFFGLNRGFCGGC